MNYFSFLEYFWCIWIRCQCCQLCVLWENSNVSLNSLFKLILCKLNANLFKWLELIVSFLWVNCQIAADAIRKSLVAAPRFPRRERQPEPPTCLLENFGRKLRKNERIWTEWWRACLAPFMDSPMIFPFLHALVHFMNRNGKRLPSFYKLTDLILNVRVEGKLSKRKNLIIKIKISHWIRKIIFHKSLLAIIAEADVPVNEWTFVCLALLRCLWTK